MRPGLSKALVALAVPALMMSSTTAGLTQSAPSTGAVLEDCPDITLQAAGAWVALAPEQSVESSSGVLCRYSNDTGSVKPFIEIHWTLEGSTPLNPAGACELAPGDVLKVGITWNSRKRMVEASWSQGIPLDGDPDTEKQLLGDLVRKLEEKGVGAPCADGEALPTQTGTRSTGRDEEVSIDVEVLPAAESDSPDTASGDGPEADDATAAILDPLLEALEVVELVPKEVRAEAWDPDVICAPSGQERRDMRIDDPRFRRALAVACLLVDPEGKMTSAERRVAFQLIVSLLLAAIEQVESEQRRIEEASP